MKEYIGVDLGKRKAVVVKKEAPRKDNRQSDAGSERSGIDEVLLEAGLPE